MTRANSFGRIQHYKLGALIADPQFLPDGDGAPLPEDSYARHLMSMTNKKRSSSKQSITGKKRSEEGAAPVYWSAEATQKSNALDLEPGIFTLDDPRAIARSLKRSAQASTRRKSTPFRSAISMLTFYINRAGKGLPEERKRILERAKEELKKEFGLLPETSPAGSPCRRAAKLKALHS